MLTTYLNALPYTKFILIEDSVTNKAGAVLEFLHKKHEKQEEYATHCFVFERRISAVRSSHPRSICYDFNTDSRNWNNTRSEDLHTVVSKLDDNCVVVVDSLAHVLFRYGLSQTYKIFTELKQKKNVHQVVAVLHTDLLEDKEKVVQYFEHVATLFLELEEKRVLYTYKKSQRKIIKEIEEYRFDDDRFITEKIKKPDKEDIKKENIAQINPEIITTFKIGLTEKDKESRSNLVLPYLPKENGSTEGKIHYTFDEIDDWDEEDPDDDLDI